MRLRIGTVLRGIGVAAVAVLVSLSGAHAKDMVLPRVGEPAPTFSATTLDGEKFTLEELRGNVIVVNFWATWCEPCRKELPLLDAYARQRGDRGLKIVAVTTDGDRFTPSSLKKFQSFYGFSLLKKFKGEYAPIKNAIPTNYVIDRAGVVRYAASGAFDLDKINAILVPLLLEQGGPAASTQPQPESTDQ